MNPTLGHVRLPLGLLALAAVACGSATDDAGSAESGVTVTPTGNDHPGQLVVTVPAGVTPNDSNDIYTADNAAITFATPYTLSIGNHTLQNRHCHNLACNASTVGFAIQNHATTTVSLGAIGFKRSQADGLLGVDAVMTVSPRGSGYDQLTASISNQPVAEDTAQSVGYRIPSAYSYAFGLFDGFQTTVEPGKVDTVDLDGKTNRRQVRIVAPARSLPDAPSCAGWSITARRPDGANATNGGRISNVAAGAVVLIGELITNGAVPATYTLQTGSFDQYPVAFSLGDVGADPATLNVGRIDVADVAVKQNDGTTVTYHGNYTLSRVTTNSAGGETLSPVCVAPTNSGVDVMAGKYRLVTSYNTAEVGEKTTTDDVTLP